MVHIHVNNMTYCSIHTCTCMYAHVHAHVHLCPPDGFLHLSKNCVTWLVLSDCSYKSRWLEDLLAISYWNFLNPTHSAKCILLYANVSQKAFSNYEWCSVLELRFQVSCSKCSNIHQLNNTIAFGKQGFWLRCSDSLLFCQTPFIWQMTLETRRH